MLRQWKQTKIWKFVCSVQTEQVAKCSKSVSTFCLIPVYHFELNTVSSPSTLTVVFNPMSPCSNVASARVTSKNWKIQGSTPLRLWPMHPRKSCSTSRASVRPKLTRFWYDTANKYKVLSYKWPVNKSFTLITVFFSRNVIICGKYQ